MLIGQMRQSPPKGECTCRGSFDEVTEVEDLRSKRQLVPDYTAEGYLLLTKCAVAASGMRRYAGEGAVRFVTLDEMYAHRRAHRPLLADGPYDASWSKTSSVLLASTQVKMRSSLSSSQTMPCTSFPSAPT